MFSLNHFFLGMVCKFSIFYHSARSDNTIPTPTAMAVPKIISDQKINLCFVLLLSISCCFCVCLSISLTICGSSPPGFLVAIYCCSFCFLLIWDWGRVAGTTLQAPKLIVNNLLSQHSVVCNKSVVFFLLHYLTIGSKCKVYIWVNVSSTPYSFVFLLVFCGDWPCYSSYCLRWIFKAIPISVCEKNLQSSNFCHKYTYRNAV